MKKSLLFVAALFISFAALASYYECFMTTCGPTICLEFDHELSVAECLEYSDHYEKLYCEAPKKENGAL